MVYLSTSQTQQLFKHYDLQYGNDYHVLTPSSPRPTYNDLLHLHNINRILVQETLITLASILQVHGLSTQLFLREKSQSPSQNRVDEIKGAVQDVPNS